MYVSALICPSYKEKDQDGTKEEFPNAHRYVVILQSWEHFYVNEYDPTTIMRY